MKKLSAGKTLAIAALAFTLAFAAIACSRFGITTSASKQWAYFFVQWNDHSYVVTDETVGQAERGELLGKIIKHSTDEHDEFPNGSSNYLPEGAELYAITGLEPDQYIAAGRKDGTYIKAVAREIWEKTQVPNSNKNFAEIYRLALDSFLPLDQALNHDMQFIAIDTSTLQDATEDDKKQVLQYFERYGVEVLDASLEQLKAQGHFDEKTLALDGILLRIKSLDIKPGGVVSIEGSKYRSGKGAIWVRSTLIYQEGQWQVKEAKITGIS